VGAVDVREELHKLVDRVPDDEAERVREVLEAVIEGRADPKLLQLATAPWDDEAVTPEEEAAIAEAMDDIKQGRLIPHEEIKREFLGGR
jgi:predicted transcriptional regulator